MPHRPKRKLTGKRPSWDKSPDYWLCEKNRQELVQKMREEATSFTETEIMCPGCDQKVWEADRDGGHWAGCHCLTMRLPFAGPVTVRLWNHISELYGKSKASPGATMMVRGLEEFR
jgi:hypothetical protein